jgi:electron transfer flavoprotein beta subunit
VEILVPIKAVPLGAHAVELAPGGGLKPPAELRLDPINEVAIEWAARILDVGGAERVTAMAIGPAAVDGVLRSAVARGCTDAVRVPVDRAELLPVSAVAHAVAAVARARDAAIVALGYESYDSSGGVVPAAVAGLLDRPLRSRVVAAAIEGSRLVTTQVREAGLRSVGVDLPVVLSLVEGQVIPRNPSLAASLTARRREIPTFEADSLVAGVGSWLDRLERIDRVPPLAREPVVLSLEAGVQAIAAWLDRPTHSGTGAARA